MKKIIIGCLALSLVLTVKPASLFAQDTATGPAGNKPKKELKIAVGRVKKTVAHIVGAQIAGLSGTTLTVTKDGKTYSVATDSKTRLRRHFWGKSDFAEFSVGNTVNIWGLYTDEAQTAIEAKMVRNLSVMMRFGVFLGNVKTKGTGSFTIESKQRGEQTVYFDTATKFVNRRGQSLKYDEVKAGDRVRVKGLWDKSANKITQVREVKDYSLPSAPTKAATPTK